MKKLISLVIALTLACSIIACGGNDQSSNEPTPTPVSTPSPTPTPTPEPTPTPTPTPTPEPTSEQYADVEVKIANLSMTVSSAHEVEATDDTLNIKIDDDTSIFVYAGETVPGLENVMVDAQQRLFVNRFDTRYGELTGSDTFAGLDATMDSFTATFNNWVTSISVLVVSFGDAEHCYTVMFTCLSSSEKLGEYLDEFGDILRSMEIKGE